MIDPYKGSEQDGKMLIEISPRKITGESRSVTFMNLKPDSVGQLRCDSYVGVNFCLLEVNGSLNCSNHCS